MTGQVWDTRLGRGEWASVDEFSAAVAEVEKVKAAAEDAFRAALEAGCVLVETWVVGIAPTVHVWTGREKWHDPTHTTAAHVANRFRAGWTRVEVKRGE